MVRHYIKFLQPWEKNPIAVPKLAELADIEFENQFPLWWKIAKKRQQQVKLDEINFGEARFYYIIEPVILKFIYSLDCQIKYSNTSHSRTLLWPFSNLEISLIYYYL